MAEIRHSRDKGLPLCMMHNEGLDLKTRLLAPFFPRYKSTLAARKMPDEMRTIMQNLVMTEDRRFLFLRNQKAGCTSIAQLMYAYTTGDFYSRTIHRARTGIHLARYDWDLIQSVYQAGTATLFTFVRDPESRVYSSFRNFLVDRSNLALRKHWQPLLANGYDPDGDHVRNFDVFLDYIERCLDLDPYLTDTHFRPQVLNIAFGKIDYDFIGRLENIGHDLPRVFALGGRPEFPPAEIMDHRFNASQVKPAPLTPEQRKRVRQIFAADYEAFSYD